VRRPAGAHPLVIATVFGDMLGYGIVTPLLPLQAQAAGATPLLVGGLLAGYAALQAVCGPLIARWSDRAGRRPALLLCLAGSAAGYLTLAFAESLALIGLALVFDAVTGANLSVAQAYLADTTPAEQRARRFGLATAAYGIGLVCGPWLTSLAGAWGAAAPLLLAAGLAALNLVLVAALLPEPVRGEALPAPAAGAAPSGITRLLLVIFLVNIAFNGLQAIVPLVSQQRFGWGIVENGRFYGFVAVVALLTQVLLVPLLGRWRDDDWLTRAGCAIAALGLAAMGLAPGLLAGSVAAALTALGVNLAIVGLTSRIATAGGALHHGQTMGTLQWVLNAALIVGPLCAGVLLEHAGPSAPFTGGALAALLALCIALRRPRAGSHDGTTARRAGG
jgi:DHA1 family tetracycline resistance protein-like MFS transporter